MIPDEERCTEVAPFLDPPIRCDLPAGHFGNSHTFRVGNETLVWGENHA